MKTSKKKFSKKKISKIASLALAVSAGTFWHSRLQAVTSFDAISFKPASDHGYYLTVQQSQTLKRGGFALGVTGEFSDNSFVLKDPAGNSLQDVIGKEISLDFGGSIGLVDWMDVGVTVTGVPFQKFVTPGALGSDDGARMGDIVVNLKAKLLDNERYALGIALIPFMSIPTGNSEHYTGNGKVTGGGMVVLDTHRIADRISFAVNAGAQFRNEVALSPSARSIDDQFIYGGSMNVAVAKPVQAIAEVNGWTTFDNFFDSNNRNLEINGGLRFLPAGETAPLAFTVGGGAGLEKDNPGAPDWRVFSTLSYRQPRRDEGPEPIPPPPEPVRERVITTNQIHFAFNKYIIKPESYRILDEIFDEINESSGQSAVESVRVEGHTDSVGSDAYNDKLSEQRANSVRTYFVKKGYPADKITAVGMGEGTPVADNATKEGRAENRRVEFHLQLTPGANVKVEKKKEYSPTYEEGDRVRRRKQENL